jgi:hypothetical protein
VIQGRGLVTLARRLVHPVLGGVSHVHAFANGRASGMR